jgi:hypothetical protein
LNGETVAAAAHHIRLLQARAGVRFRLNRAFRRSALDCFVGFASSQ